MSDSDTMRAVATPATGTVPRASAAPATDPFHELQQVLQEFRAFLDGNVATIKPAIQALHQVLPQVNDLIDKLSALMTSLKAEIQRLDPNAIPGLDKVTAMTGQVGHLLDSIGPLMPGEAAAIGDVRTALGVVGSLQQLGQLKADLLTLIDAIIADLNQLKA